MSTINIILVVAAVVLIGIPIGVSVLVTVPMARAKVTRIPDERTHQTLIKASRAVDEAQVAALGFTLEGVYDIDLGGPRALFVMWRHGRDATCLAAYTHSSMKNGTWITDIVSILSEHPRVALTTSVTKDGHVAPPRRGDHMQTFDNPSLGALWERHTEAEVYLAEKTGVVPGKVDMPGGQMLETYVRDSSRYRLQRPWVWLSVPYRYWIGRHLWHNRPVAKAN